MTHAAHALIGHLFSTSSTRFVYDGITRTRWEKTELIAQSGIALDTLRVCWVSRDEKNCGQYVKCCRTMLTLGLLGALDRCKAFNQDSVGLGRALKIRVPNYVERFYLLDLFRAARERGRENSARTIGRCLRRSKYLDFWLPVLRRGRARLLARRMATAIEWRLTRDIIRK